MRYEARTGGQTDQGEFESCAEHLMMTGCLCGAFTESFGLLKTGVKTGLAHDIGKYSDEFQKRIRGCKIRVDHSTVGAKLLADTHAVLPAFAVMGHHSGLPDIGTRGDDPSEDSFCARCKRSEQTRPSVPVLSSSVESEIEGVLNTNLVDANHEEKKVFQRSQSHTSAISSPDPGFQIFSIAFAERMLFSSLVDADRLDAEYFTRGNCRKEGADLDWLSPQVRSQVGEREILNSSDVSKAAEFADRLATRIRTSDLRAIDRLWKIQNDFNEKLAQKSSLSALNRKRAELLDSCLRHAHDNLGLFTLTAPTGSGKTNASLSFALKHAVEHGLRRVIYVIPYMSIIDQTVSNFEREFPADQILPHYSEANFRFKDPDQQSETDVQRLNAAENWNMPLVVTTAVQFFESLFSNQPSRCRKLHNIADSVIIFDEAQTLPSDFLRPCVKAIDELVRFYGCTAVLCTATQPELQEVFNSICISGEKPLQTTDITTKDFIQDPVFHRVTFRQTEEKQSDDDIADTMSENSECLTVVNTRKAAHEIYQRLTEKVEDSDSVYCLTTLLTPYDRKKQIHQMREDLSNRENCRVVSTSLIEAGVDVDFPFVMREQAGLDSILQTAGRCNREGKRLASQSPVTVYVSSDHKVPRYMKQSIAAFNLANDMFQSSEKAVAYTVFDSPSLIASYFIQLRSLRTEGGLDVKDILKHRQLDFAKICNDFHIIDSDTQTIYIPENDEAHGLCSRLIHNDEEPLTSADYRRLGQYSVQLYDCDIQSLKESGKLIDCGIGFVLADESLYTEKLGVDSQIDPNAGLFF